MAHVNPYAGTSYDPWFQQKTWVSPTVHPTPFRVFGLQKRREGDKVSKQPTGNSNKRQKRLEVEERSRVDILLRNDWAHDAAERVWNCVPKRVRQAQQRNAAALKPMLLEDVQTAVVEARLCALPPCVD